MTTYRRSDDKPKVINAKILTLFVVSCVVSLIAGAYFGVRAAPEQKSQTSCPTDWVCVDPAKTSCLIFDMSIAGYSPVSEEKRMWISGLAYDGRAEYLFVPNAIDCYHRHPDLSLGAHVGTLRSEWWRWKRKRKGGTR